MKILILVAIVTLSSIPNESSASPLAGSDGGGRAVKICNFVPYKFHTLLFTSTLSIIVVNLNHYLFWLKDKQLGETCKACFSINIPEGCGLCADGLDCMPQKDFGIIVTDKPWKCIKDTVVDLTGM